MPGSHPNELASVITTSPIAQVPYPSDEDVTSLRVQLNEITCGDRPANKKTASNLLRAARRADPEAASTDVASFVAWKLRIRGGGIRTWGGVLTAVLEEYGAWRACRDSAADITNTPAQNATFSDENATVAEVLQHLMAIRDARRETWGWPPPNESTARTILSAVRKRYPTASSTDLGQYVCKIIIRHSFRGWGGVIVAIRGGW